MPKLHYFLIFTFLLGAKFLTAQDEHFTLFQRAPLHYGPALTGISDYELRGGLNYRGQWASIDKPFTTMSAYADKSMELGHDRVGFGALLMNDRTGPRRLNAAQLKLSAAYHKRIGHHYFSGALQPGFIYQSISDPTLPSQYDPATGNFNRQNQGAVLDNPFVFDLGAGLAYQYKTSDWQVGISQSALHLTQPNNSFTGDPEEKLSMRHVTYLWSKLPVARGELLPRVLFMTQNVATEAMVSVSYAQTIHGELYGAARLSGGLAFRDNFKGADGRSLTRSMDAMSILFGVGWENYQLDLAYDINTTDLSEASGYRGGFELALTYRMGAIPTIQKVTVPCIRY